MADHSCSPEVCGTYEHERNCALRRWAEPSVGAQIEEREPGTAASVRRRKQGEILAKVLRRYWPELGPIILELGGEDLRHLVRETLVVELPRAVEYLMHREGVSHG